MALRRKICGRSVSLVPLFLTMVGSYLVYLMTVNNRITSTHDECVCEHTKGETSDIKLPEIKANTSVPDPLVLETKETKVVINRSCIHPELTLWPDDFKKYYKAVPSLDCKKDEENWVFTSNGSVYITEQARKKHGNIICNYLPLKRGKDEYAVVYGMESTSFETNTPLASDFFEVRCTGEDGATFESLNAGIRHDKNLQDTKKSNSNALNFLVIGFDSVSRFQWLRKLPKTYKYLTETLGGLVLESYNIVAEGTTGSLIPLFTGKTEVELPEARKGFKNASALDVYPWIWKKLKKLGYVTQWAEASTRTIQGVFTYRLKGFKAQPVDHYMRPFYVHNHKFYGGIFECTGSSPSHQVMLNWVGEFFDAYPNKPKFSFMFHGIYSHNWVHKLHWADTDLADFLKLLNTQGHLENTVLVLMSDHGQRVSSIRNTFQGKYEERLPFFAFRFPKKFQKQYPKAMENFRWNSQQLSTPFDVHATFEDLIKFSGAGVGDLKQRGISLFKEIPTERTCEHAMVEPHWCTCLRFSDMDVAESNVQKAAMYVVDLVNHFTKNFRVDCTELTLLNVTRAAQYAPSESLLKFAQSRKSFRELDFSDKMKAPEILYQITISTAPNSGAYEATVKYLVAKDKFVANVYEVSRVNEYGNQPHCIMERMPDLRPYCYCRKQL